MTDSLPDTAALAVEVTEPGVVYDLPEDVYHADPVPGGSLSHSGAKTLLQAPAKYAYEREHGRPDKKEFEFGRAAHSLILGVGQPLVEVPDVENWRTKAAQDRAAEIRADGGIPLLSEQMRQVEAMATALHAHRIARALLDPDRGRPEVSMFRRDPDSGVMLRCRYDWLPNPTSGRLIGVDYKTAADADPDAFAREAARFHYPMQAAFYTDMAAALGVADDVAFVFIVQEKTAPYLVSVVELDAEAVRAGRRNYRRAIDIYTACMASGEWPGYSTDVALRGVPAWYVYDSEKDTAA